MPAASGSARTQFTHLGLYSQRYGSFAGKTPALVVVGTIAAMCIVEAENRIVRVASESRVALVEAENRIVLVRRPPRG
jgi:hypothetical protein